MGILQIINTKHNKLAENFTPANLHIQLCGME